MTSQQQAEQLYTSKANLYQRIFINSSYYPKGIEAFFKENLEVFNDSNTVLDAGTGTGTLIRALYNAGPGNKFEMKNFETFDISNAMLEVFKTWISVNNFKNIKVFQSDVLKLDRIKRNVTYDMIMSSGMLEYVSRKDFVTALKILKEKLNRDGKLLLFISKRTFFNMLCIKLWWKANLYSKDELLSSLKQAGFQNIKLHLFPKRYNLLNHWGFIIEAS